MPDPTTQPTPTADSDLGDTIAAERRELAILLGALPSHAWDAPSLCSGWRVREVVAHITMPFRYPPTRFLFEIVKSGGNFSRMADRCARRDASATTGGLLAALRDNERHPWKPPGGGYDGALTHDVIHGLDITVPLGIHRQIPEDRIRVVLQTVTGRQSLGHFGVDLDGIELRADNIDWTFGSGTPLTGTAQDLALVLCGRKLPTERLRGELSGRFTHPRANR